MKPVLQFLKKDGDVYLGEYTQEGYTTSKKVVVPKHQVTLIYDVKTSTIAPVLCELKKDGEVKGYAIQTWVEE